MANILKVKRTTSTSNPSELSHGELGVTGSKLGFGDSTNSAVSLMREDKFLTVTQAQYTTLFNGGNLDPDVYYMISG